MVFDNFDLYFGFFVVWYVVLGGVEGDFGEDFGGGEEVFVGFVGGGDEFVEGWGLVDKRGGEGWGGGDGVDDVGVDVDLGFVVLGVFEDVDEVVKDGFGGDDVVGGGE